jgi:hypothetical protein
MRGKLPSRILSPPEGERNPRGKTTTRIPPEFKRLEKDRQRYMNFPSDEIRAIWSPMPRRVPVDVVVESPVDLIGNCDGRRRVQHQ